MIWMFDYVLHFFFICLSNSNLCEVEYEFNQVADFGLAKLTTDTNTHVSTRVMGTFG